MLCIVCKVFDEHLSRNVQNIVLNMLRTVISLFFYILLSFDKPIKMYMKKHNIIPKATTKYNCCCLNCCTKLCNYIEINVDLTQCYRISIFQLFVYINNYHQVSYSRLYRARIIAFYSERCYMRNITYYYHPFYLHGK